MHHAAVPFRKGGDVVTDVEGEGVGIFQHARRHQGAIAEDAVEGGGIEGDMPVGVVGGGMEDGFDLPEATDIALREGNDIPFAVAVGDGILHGGSFCLFGVVWVVGFGLRDMFTMPGV